MARLSNINAVLDMVEQYLNGEMSRISFQFDFPYEIEQRYRKMVREDADWADMIYVYLLEEGVDVGDDLSDSQFRALIKRQYNDVKDGVW